MGTVPPHSVRVLGLVPSVALVATGAAYLAWRVVETRTGAEPVMFWVLWTIEVLSWSGLTLLVVAAGTRARDSSVQPAPPGGVELVVVVRDEPTEVVTACLRACLTLPGTPTVLVADASGRPEVVEGAGRIGLPVVSVELGAREPAEAALHQVARRLQAPFVAIVPAEIVPLPALVEDLPGCFTSEEVWAAQGLVQLRPLVGGGPGPALRPHPALQAGRAHHGVALYGGAGGLVRRSALEELVGVRDPTGPRLSVAAVERGWHCAHLGVPSALAFVPGSHDTDGQSTVDLCERARLLRGGDSPLWTPGLSMAQRLCLFRACTASLASPLRVAAVAVLVATLLTGRTPIAGPVALLVVVCGLWWLLYDHCRARLEADRPIPLRGAAARWMVATSQCTAWLRAGRAPRQRGPRRRVQRSRLLPGTLLALLSGATAWTLVAAMAAVLRDDPPSAVTTAAILLGLATCASLWPAARRTRRRRRAADRFPFAAIVVVGAERHHLRDLSEAGMALEVGRPMAIGTPLVATLHLPGLDGRVHPATAAAEVRWLRRNDAPGDTGWLVGMEFTHLSDAALARIRECSEVLLPAAAAVSGAAAPRAQLTA